MKTNYKVICVDDSPCKCGTCGAQPMPIIKGLTYVVEGTYPHTHGPAVIIVGVYFPNHKLGEYRTISVKRFRLLSEFKHAAISISEPTTP